MVGGGLFLFAYWFYLLYQIAIALMLLVLLLFTSAHSILCVSHEGQAWNEYPELARLVSADLGPTKRALRRTSASSWYLDPEYIDLECLNH